MTPATGSAITSGAGAVFGAAAEVYSAEIARAQAAKNRQATKEENARQLQWAMEQQGWYGAPTWLQGDMGDQENEAIKQATDIWNATYRDPTQSLDEYNAISAMMKPTAYGVYSDIGSGAWLDRSLADMQPLHQARMDQAQGASNAWLETLKERANAINISNAAAGFGSTGALTQNNLLQNDYGARRAAMDSLGGARTLNEQENSAAKSAYQALRLNTGTNAPGIAQSLMAMDSIGTQQAVNDFSNRSNVFKNFAVQRGAGLNTQAATTQPYESAAGAGLASLAGSVSGFGNYLAERQNSKDMLAMIAALNQGRKATPYQPFTDYNLNPAIQGMA